MISNIQNNYNNGHTYKAKQGSTPSTKLSIPGTSAPPEDLSLKDTFDYVTQSFKEKHDVVHEGMEAIHIGAEVLETLEAAGALAMAGTVGAAASGVFFGIEGVKDLKKAVKEKNVTEGIEAGAHLSLAGEAAIGVTAEVAELGAASGILGHSVAAALSSPILHAVGAGLGVAHGAGEVILGGKDIVEGVKEKNRFKILEGALTSAIGVAVGAIALGGGAPVGIALATVFTGKMILKTAFGKKLKSKMEVKFNSMFDKGNLEYLKDDKSSEVK